MSRTNNTYAYGMQISVSHDFIVEEYEDTLLNEMVQIIRVPLIGYISKKDIGFLQA